MIQNEEFIQEFIEEARGHIEKVEASLLMKETARNTPEAINDMFRAIHSVKGTAGFFGLKRIVELAHAMESLLGDIRSERLALHERNAELLLEGVDLLRLMVEDVHKTQYLDITAILDRLEQALNGDGGTQTAAEAEAPKPSVVVRDPEDRRYEVEGAAGLLLKDALSSGHHLYEIRLGMNRDLNQYPGGRSSFSAKSRRLASW